MLSYIDEGPIIMSLQDLLKKVCHCSIHRIPSREPEMTGLATVDGPIEWLRCTRGNDGAHELDQAITIDARRDALCFDRFSHSRQKGVRIVRMEVLSENSA